MAHHKQKPIDDVIKKGERRCNRCDTIKVTDRDFDFKGNGTRYMVCRTCRDGLSASCRARRAKAIESRGSAPSVSCWLRSPDSPVLSITMGAFYQTYFRMVTSRW